MKVTLEVDFAVDAPDYRSLGADTEEIASRGRRVMAKRDLHTGQFSLFVAEQGTMSAGWVLAVEEKGGEL